MVLDANGKEQVLAAAMFNALASGSESFFSCLDRQRRILFVNRTVSRDRTELIGRGAEEFVAPENRQALVDALETAFTQQRHTEVEYHAVLADGRRMWLRTHVRPFQGPFGEPLAMQISIDLSEQRRLEDE